MFESSLYSPHFFYKKRRSSLTWCRLFPYLEICRRHTRLMWLVTEEDSPTNKTRGLRGTPLL
nr:MAG TPA: hypothetical protein [Microviridae sp.]